MPVPQVYKALPYLFPSRDMGQSTTGAPQPTLQMRTLMLRGCLLIHSDLPRWPWEGRKQPKGLQLASVSDSVPPQAVKCKMSPAKWESAAIQDLYWWVGGFLFN